MHLATALALSLTGCTLIGCAQASRGEHRTEVSRSTMQPPVRVIIHFSRLPVADDTKLTALISEACRCPPVFLRQYNSNALIYEIGLPEGETFASFEKALLAGGVLVGIQAVERDALMQHQR